MESSTCLPPTMLSWLGGRFFGACAESLWPTAGPDTAPFRVVQASELLRSPRCYHQEVLTIAPSGGITGLFLWGMREGRRRVGAG